MIVAPSCRLEFGPGCGFRPMVISWPRALYASNCIGTGCASSQDGHAAITHHTPNQVFYYCTRMSIPARYARRPGACRAQKLISCIEGDPLDSGAGTMAQRVASSLHHPCHVLPTGPGEATEALLVSGCNTIYPDPILGASELLEIFVRVAGGPGQCYCTCSPNRCSTEI
ncbi:hypothetical protein BD779DRAFT_492680 [Infundibulicybe gibba]|nr:hypothetical protein BD779DRAFT_492680 [Infundibulicybe gibba]